MDDLYLPHEQLTALASNNPNNGLLHGRGLPGTHDLPLGAEVLNALRHINSREGKVVQLPIYDKSQYGGLGDRSQETNEVKGPLDLVIFEGQFAPLTSSFEK